MYMSSKKSGAHFYTYKNYIILHLICDNCYLEKLLVRGGELSARARKSVVWKDVESAFEGRLKTGVIVNLATFSRMRKFNF